MHETKTIASARNYQSQAHRGSFLITRFVLCGRSMGCGEVTPRRHVARDGKWRQRSHRLGLRRKPGACGKDVIGQCNACTGYRVEAFTRQPESVARGAGSASARIPLTHEPRSIGVCVLSEGGQPLACF